MTSSRNANHPKKGDRLEVEPIRRLEDIRAISQLTQSNPRDHLLFVMGINNGLRTCDLLRLRVKDVRDLKPGETLKIIESKTGKENVLMVNRKVFKALHSHLEAVDSKDSDYLFRSRKGNKPLQSQAVGKMIKKWTEAINLRGRFGAHSMRKTFGFIQRTVYGVGFEVLCKRYNHSSPAVTMRYLGIEDKEVNEALLKEKE